MPHAAPPCETMKQRLRHDLVLAMKARETEGVAVLRGLVAALDNAEAVPLPASQIGFSQAVFGDRSVETERRLLSVEDIDAILTKEALDHSQAALQLDTVDPTKADAHRRAAAQIQSYLAT